MRARAGTVFFQRWLRQIQGRELDRREDRGEMIAATGASFGGREPCAPQKREKHSQYEPRTISLEDRRHCRLKSQVQRICVDITCLFIL